MKKSTKKLTRKTSQTNPEPLPITLAALTALIGTKDLDDLRFALSAADEALAHCGDPNDVQGRFEHYIDRAVKRGAYRKPVQRAYAIDPGNMNVDLLCGIGTPALLFGMAAMWLMINGSSR